MGWKRISDRLGLTQPAEAQLVAAYQHSGEQQLLTQLFRLHADALYHFLLRQSDAELAQDLSQQCWLKFLQQRHSFQGQSSFKTWLFSIGRHLLLDEFRRQQRWGWQELSEDFVLATAIGPAELCSQSEQHIRLSMAIAQLPLLQKEALLLQLEGFALTEVAHISQSNVETVKSRLRYARAALENWLEVQDDAG